MKPGRKERERNVKQMKKKSQRVPNEALPVARKLQPRVQSTEESCSYFYLACSSVCAGVVRALVADPALAVRARVPGRAAARV
jgi:hypothetical protein